jgi:flagellar motor switch protein FliN
MNTTESSTAAPQAREYLDVWAMSLGEGLNRLLGAEVTAQQVSGEDSKAQILGPSESGFSVRLFGGKAGEQAFFLPAADSLRFAKLLGGATSEESGALSAEGQQLIVQFFKQTAAAISMKDWLGFACELEASGAEKTGWESAVDCAYQFSTSEGVLFVLKAQLSADFVSALEAAPHKSDSAGAESVLPEPPVSRPEQARDINLDLLKDVELEATLRFGQREMLLGDVLNLAPGSIVELDQQVQDPVELLVGKRVIARGEVVTVEGNYGFRVTALASREERLDSLRK